MFLLRGSFLTHACTCMVKYMARVCVCTRDCQVNLLANPILISRPRITACLCSIEHCLQPHSSKPAPPPANQKNSLFKATPPSGILPTVRPATIPALLFCSLLAVLSIQFSWDLPQLLSSYVGPNMAVAGSAVTRWLFVAPHA